MSIKTIIEGFANLGFPKHEVEQVAAHRKKMCDICPISEYGKSRFCKLSNGGCGCYLPAKRRAMDESCPKNKW